MQHILSVMAPPHPSITISSLCSDPPEKKQQGRSRWTLNRVISKRLSSPTGHFRSRKTYTVASRLPRAWRDCQSALVYAPFWDVRTQCWCHVLLESLWSVVLLFFIFKKGRTSQSHSETPEEWHLLRSDPCIQRPLLSPCYGIAPAAIPGRSDASSHAALPIASHVSSF